MKRLLVLITAFLLAAAVWAGDPWKDKPYKDWDQKDLRKILNDSPWSRKIRIENPKQEHAGLEAPEGAPSVKGAGGEEEGDEEDERRENDREGAKEADEDETIFVARWLSSRTLREAWVRNQVLSGRISAADMEKRLPPEPGDYQVALIGPDMDLFEKSDESTLRAASVLEVKKSKRKIPCVQAEILRSADGKKITGIVFHFPKKSASGEPFVGGGEKSLNFIIRAGQTEVKTSFDLSKMADAQGADF